MEGACSRRLVLSTGFEAMASPTAEID